MAADYPAVLNNWLGTAYAASVVGHSPPRVAVGALRDAVAADADLRTEATKRLASLTKSVTDKCFISRKHREFLTLVLEA
jgi:hypothetical protein